MRSSARLSWSTAVALMLGCASIAPAADAGDAPFTIEQFMQAPYPSSLVAAPKGTLAAWVFNARGVRNVWIADASATIRARPITTFTMDDGYDVGDLAWSPDARTIAFVRGQTLEDDGPANIISAPAGPSSRSIWIVSTTGGYARMIGQDHAPSFAPDGRTLAFIDKHRILAFSPSSDKAPRTLLTDFGAIRSTTWSPDGGRFAFVSQRIGHALVGVYDMTVQTITWMTPSFNGDGQPVFSPDGKQVAFIRTQTQMVQPFVSRRSGLPWSIWIADAGTGAGRAVWTADTGPGCVFRPTLSSANLLWTADGHLRLPLGEDGMAAALCGPDGWWSRASARRR